MKSYTDLEQSKKLAEILPIESADMCYVIDYAESNKYGTDHFNLEIDTYGLKVITRDNIPCWSLAALLSVLPEGTRLLKATNISSIGDTKYHCDCPKGNIDDWFDNPVDACYEMIIELNELKRL